MCRKRQFSQKSTRFMALKCQAHLSRGGRQCNSWSSSALRNERDRLSMPRSQLKFRSQHNQGMAKWKDISRTVLRGVQCPTPNTLPQNDKLVSLSNFRDWSPEGEGFPISQLNSDTHRSEIWPLSAGAHSEAKAVPRRIVFNPAYNLFQASFSADGRWIVFEAVRDPPNLNVESDLYVMPAAGGPLSRKANLGTTSLAGLPTATQFTSFLAVHASSTCGESTSIQKKESHSENRSA